MTRLSALLLGALVVGAAAPSAAQVPLRGVVLDSLAGGRPLPDAEVWLDGTGRVARTDGQGRFVLPDVPPGTYRIGFDHAQLDRMRLAGPVRTITVGTTPPEPLTLAMPSPETLYAALCGVAAEPNLGVLLGRVRRAEGRVPAGTPVAASWTLWTLAKGGLRQQPRETYARTDSLGEFKLCAVPSDVPVMLRAQAADGAAAAAEVSLGELALAVRELDLPDVPPEEAAAPAVTPAVTRASAAPSSARFGAVEGRVRTAEGRSVANAQVQLVATGRSVTADAQGAFTLPDVAPGPQMLEVRAIGFRPVRTMVTVVAGRRTRLATTFDERVTVLATLKVVGGRTAISTTGFEERRRAGNGVFISRGDIERRRAYSTNDLFAGIPGVEVRLQGFGARVVFSRALGQAGVMANNCEPVYFVDGIRYRGVESPDADAASRSVSPIALDQFLRPADIEGIEVYRNLASAPPQFQPLDASCGVIVVWTRRRPSQ